MSIDKGGGVGVLWGRSSGSERNKVRKIGHEHLRRDTRYLGAIFFSFLAFSIEP